MAVRGPRKIADWLTGQKPDRATEPAVRQDLTNELHNRRRDWPLRCAVNEFRSEKDPRFWRRVKVQNGPRLARNRALRLELLWRDQRPDDTLAIGLRYPYYY